MFNVFGIDAGLKILEMKVEQDQWYIIKPFLVLLKIIRNDQYTNIPMDQHVVEQLRKI